MIIMAFLTMKLAEPGEIAVKELESARFNSIGYSLYLSIVPKNMPCAMISG